MRDCDRCPKPRTGDPRSVTFGPRHGSCSRGCPACAFVAVLAANAQPRRVPADETGCASVRRGIGCARPMSRCSPHSSQSSRATARANRAGTRMLRRRRPLPPRSRQRARLTVQPTTTRARRCSPSGRGSGSRRRSAPTAPPEPGATAGADAARRCVDRVSTARHALVDRYNSTREHSGREKSMPVRRVARVPCPCRFVSRLAASLDARRCGPVSPTAGRPVGRETIRCAP